MGQVHLKLLIRSVQTPPFLHGLELHSSISMWQFLPLKPIDQREKKNEFIIKIIASAIFPTSISTTAVHPVDNMMDAKNMLLGREQEKQSGSCYTLLRRLSWLVLGSWETFATVTPCVMTELAASATDSIGISCLVAAFFRKSRGGCKRHLICFFPLQL